MRALAFLAAVLVVSMAGAAAAKPKWALVVHGGAGVIERGRLKPEQERAYREALAQVVEAGSRAVMLYLIQIGSASRFALARDIDPIYGAAYDRARQRGVEAMAWKCAITRESIEVATPVPIIEQPGVT